MKNLAKAHRALTTSASMPPLIISQVRGSQLLHGW